MAMAAGAMVRGSSPSSLLRSPAPPLRSPSLAVSIPSGEVCEDMSASSKIRGDPAASGKICEVSAVEAGGSGGRRELLNTDKVTDTAAVAADASFTAARFPASSSMRTQQHQPQESSETCGELQRSSETRMEQRDGSEVPRSLLASNKRSKKVPIKNSEKTSLTTGRKRPLSDASGSLRARKAAKVINAKVDKTKLQTSSKTVRKKVAQIVSSSPMMNIIARRRVQSNSHCNNRLSHLRKNLVDRNLIHHKGNLLQIRCAAHVLNLIVQDGLKTMKSVVDNVRESVKYVRSSQYRKEQFDKIVAQTGIKCKHEPSLDVSTRWNSTFIMLESVLPFRKVFKTLEDQEPSYIFGPSNEEWKMVEDICQLVKVFCHATNVISGSNYPTSNLYFLEIWGVKIVLDEQEKSENATIRVMVKEMKKKFHKYFMESYLTNCVPLVFDPRFKMEHVEFRLKQYFGVEAANKHIIEVKEAIAALFIAYAIEFVDNGNSSSQERNNEEVVLADSALSDWHEHVKIKEATSRCELQRYLEEGFHPCTPDFDILQWWAVNSARYPILGNIARDVLAVPASSVASESAFSTCGRVITEALMCYGDWIKHDGSFPQTSTPHE